MRVPPWVFGGLKRIPNHNYQRDCNVPEGCGGSGRHGRLRDVLLERCPSIQEGIITRTDSVEVSS